MKLFQLTSIIRVFRLTRGESYAFIFSRAKIYWNYASIVFDYEDSKVELLALKRALRREIGVSAKLMLRTTVIIDSERFLLIPIYYVILYQFYFHSKKIEVLILVL
jgi:hypothetical protein